MLQSLADDLGRLCHFPIAQHVAVVAVADLTSWHFEIETVVDTVRLVLAQVDLDTGCAQVGAVDAVVFAHFCIDDTDVFGTGKEDFVAV